MPRYSQQQRDQVFETARRGPRIHPIWRGVGFAFMVLAPIIAYFAAELLIAENAKSGWLQIPQDLIVQWQDPLILVKLIIVLFITFVLYALFSMVYFIVFRTVGPSRYGPYDVPPVAYKGKPYKR